MKKNHDCKEVVDSFNQLLDGELNPKQEQEVMCELQRCIHCLEAYNLEDRYRNFVKERFQKQTVSDTFLNKLKKSCTEGDAPAN